MREKEVETMRKIKLFERLAGISGIIMMFLSWGIVGNNDCNVATSMWVYVIYAISVITCAFCLFYSGVLKERREAKLRSKARRRELRAQMEAEFEAELAEELGEELCSNIVYLNNYRNNRKQVKM